MRERSSEHRGSAWVSFLRAVDFRLRSASMRRALAARRENPPFSLSALAFVSFRSLVRWLAGAPCPFAPTYRTVTTHHPPPAPTQGVFTKELDEVLLNGKVDIVVHCLKDLATLLPDGIGNHQAAAALRFCRQIDIAA
jgi:hypothetical protein